MNKNLGQLIITGISGKELSSQEESFIKENNIGGVILFKNNYDNPAQLAELTNHIQSLRDEQPLFISVDQEGGRVVRFKDHFTQFPSMLDLAGFCSPKDIYMMSALVARQLHSCGINLNFAPCCDVFTNESNTVIGDRAFGKDSDTVCKFISSAIRGYQVNGVLACAKHFPGHGNTLKDSHHDLPFVTKTMDELKDLELKPFIKAIQSKVEFMMMAHLVVDAFDEKLPTSLASEAYEFIRSELKFNRPIITDDMQMQAILKQHTVEESSVMAINAGADILCYRDLDAATKAFEALNKALEVKKLCPNEMNFRLKRVSQSKKRNLSEYKPCYIPDLEKSFRLTNEETALMEKIKQQLQ